MAEYIEREKLIKKIDDYFSKTDPNGQEQIGVLKCRGIIREMPPADVAPVKHRKWLAGELDFCVCSVCGNEIPEHAISPYCDECGAKMDGEE